MFQCLFRPRIINNPALAHNPFWFRRRRIKYEIRMGFHKVGAVGFGIALVLHARAPRYVMGITLAIYALDVLYCSFARHPCDGGAAEWSRRRRGAWARPARTSTT